MMMINPKRIGMVAILAFTIALPAQARPAKCLLEIEGKTYIDGQCDFKPLHKSDGSFQITGANGKHFAYVYVDGGQTATAHWNGAIGENRAHDPLGNLTRDGACWNSKTVKLCAW